MLEVCNAIYYLRLPDLIDSYHIPSPGPQASESISWQPLISHYRCIDSHLRNTRYRSGGQRPPTAKVVAPNWLKPAIGQLQSEYCFALSRRAKLGDLEKIRPSFFGHEVVLYVLVSTTSSTLYVCSGDQHGGCGLVPLFR